jgi:hypothetical protein
MIAVFCMVTSSGCCRRLDIRKFLDGVYVSEKGLVVKGE